MDEPKLGRRSFLRGGAALVGGAALLGAGACGGGSSGGGSGSNGGSKEFTLWSMWTKGEAGQKLVQGAIDDFQKATGIKVNVQWKGRGVQTAILPAVTAGKPPADMMENGATMVQQLTPGNMVDMSDVYDMAIPNESQKVGDVISKQYREKAAYYDNDGKASSELYALPYWASTYAVFYNGNNYSGIKTKQPATWPDFMAILDQTKSAGKMAPLALDGSITGYNFYYFQFMSFSSVGPNAILDGTMDTTGQTWKKPGYLAAAQLIEKLAKGGYFIKGYDASKFPAMEDEWADNKAGFLLMGSWIKEEVLPVAASGFDFQAFPMPAMDGAKPPTALVSVDGFGIFKKSKNVDACKKFMAFFMQKKYQEQVASILDSIPLRPDVQAPVELEQLKRPLDAGNINTAVIPPKASSFGTDVLYPADDQLIFGKVTAEQFIDKLAADTASWWKSHS